MSFTFQEADLQEEEAATLSAGVYQAEVSKIEFTEKGHLQIGFKSAESGDFLCFDWLYFSDKAKPYSARKLKALGLAQIDGKYELSDDGQELIGKFVTLTLVPDEKKPQYLTPDFSSSNHGYKKVEEVEEADIPF